MRLRDRILAKADLKEEKVFIPEWEETILVRELTASQRSQLLAKVVNEQGMNFDELYSEIVIACCFDPESKEKVFQPEDKAALGEKSGAAIERIAQVALRLNAMHSHALAEAEKN